MAADLSSLLSASKALTAHLSRPDLPSVNLTLDQIEAQSRKLVARQGGQAGGDDGKANYLLAQAQINAPALTSSIAHLPPITQTTFTPLQALHDTDVAGFLRHAHEQNLIATIEEARTETRESFWRTLEDREAKEWEAQKRRVFEELGGRVGAASGGASGDLIKGGGSADRKAGGSSWGGRSVLGASTSTPTAPPSLQVQSKMMAYDRIVTELNAARLRGTSYPIIHGLIQASLSLNTPDPITEQMIQNYHVLAKITSEPPSLPPLEHASAHILNATLLERKHARAYLSSGSSSVPSLPSSSNAPLSLSALGSSSREATDLKKQIAKGAREALEEQYFSVLERTVHARAVEARLGGDPSVQNKVRAFVAVRHWRNGEWDERIELVAGQPLWAKLFYLVRTGHLQEALEEAQKVQAAIEHREPSFLGHFKTWVESVDRKLPKPHRDHLHTLYNAHMLHSSTADSFKLALYKIIGRIDVGRRSVPGVTVTTEDWLWLQLCMIDEEDPQNGQTLSSLSELLLSYGERHFDGQPGSKEARRGVWAGVLVMCGQFERAVAALWEHQETEVDAVHLAIALAYHGLLRVPSKAETSDINPLSISSSGVPSLSLPTLIWRYVRQFVKMDPREALQYVYCITLSADQDQNLPGGGAGKEQVEMSWEMVRRVVVLADGAAGWEELVGGFRGDGTRFSGVIEQNAPLLKLTNAQDYNTHVLIRAAQHALEHDRTSEAIKLYNLAGDYNTVVSLLSHALGNTLSLPLSSSSGADSTMSGSGGAQSESAKAKEIEKTAREVLRHYERTNRAVGREREAVVRLLRVREAMEAKEIGRWEIALEIMESTDLIPLDGDVAKITRRADEFRELPESVQKNLQLFLTLTMDALAGVYQKVKASASQEATRQMTLASLRKKSRSLIVFAGILKYRMSPDVYSYLARLDVEIAL